MSLINNYDRPIKINKLFSLRHVLFAGSIARKTMRVLCGCCCKLETPTNSTWTPSLRFFALVSCVCLCESIISTSSRFPLEIYCVMDKRLCCCYVAKFETFCHQFRQFLFFLFFRERCGSFLRDYRWEME
jgi:hypothetical protein